MIGYKSEKGLLVDILDADLNLFIDNEFIKGWKDALISGNEVYYIGV